LTTIRARLISKCWLFVFAIAVFTLPSLGCAASGGFAVLIGWRRLQGLSRAFPLQ
jgi:MFS transporter, DHA2 family, multidrug resistance protein